MSDKNHQGSGTKPLSRNPNSKRTQRRRKRGFPLSRPQRRAQKRLGIAMSGYNNSKDEGSNIPGAVKHW